MNLNVILRTIRPPFLLLTLVCVFLGVATLVNGQENINPTLIALALLGAILAHISVNTLNEYSDFKSGLDLHTLKTGFSGGSGALPENPEMAKAVLATGIITLLGTLGIGVFFVLEYGTNILLTGIIGVLLIIGYTPWINRYPLLCLLAPGLGFGVLMVTGTQFVLQGHYLPLAWYVAIVPFALTNNLLLLNQYPDLQADRNAGRNHFPIAYGIDNSNRIYLFFTVLAFATITVFSFSGIFPLTSLLALLPAPLAFYAWHGAVQYGENIGQHPQYNHANVAVAILTPLLLGISLIRINA